MRHILETDEQATYMMQSGSNKTDEYTRMDFTEQHKETIKEHLVERLKPEPEIKKILIFGSFLASKNPHDIDVAIYQDSDESYLSLAMKYRRLTRSIAKMIPLDIVPLTLKGPQNSFLSEIEAGEIIYER